MKKHKKGEKTIMMNILYNFRALVDIKLYQNDNPQEEYTLLGTILTMFFFPLILLVAIIIRVIDLVCYLLEIKIKFKKEKNKCCL